MNVTRTLASYVVGSEFPRLPREAVHEAKRSFLNWIGCAIGGSRHEAVLKALKIVSHLSGPPRATVLGHQARFDVTHAAMVNTMSALVLDFDDAHSGEKIVLHPSGPAGSAALAVAELQRASGEELLHAFMLGIEVECRVGNAVYSSDNVGWYPTSAVGAIGAAACAGRLLKLSEQQMVWALSMAAAQAAGLRATHGTMTKSLSPGRGACNGVLSALLAAENFTSAEDGIGSPDVGFAALTGDFDRLDSAIVDLGQQFQILRNSYKPFACGIGIHPALDGCLQLREQYNLHPQEIEKVELQVFPRVTRANGNKDPKNGLEAKLSVFHSAAVALIDGSAGEAQYSDSRVRDRAVAEMRKRINLTADANLGKEGALVTIQLKDGKSLNRRIEHAVGTMAHPMSDRDLELKVGALVQGILLPAQARTLIESCWRLDELATLEPLQSALIRHSSCPGD